MTSPKADRLARYAEWRSWGEDRQCAALRVGIRPRTARRYEAELRTAPGTTITKRAA